MAVGTKQFTVELVTPERAEPAIRCTFAAIPGWDGQVGLLAGRAPLVCRLAAGLLRVETEKGWRAWRIGAGFAEMLDDVLTVLTDHAESADKTT